MNEDEEFNVFDIPDDTQIRFGDKQYKTEDVLLGPTSVLTKIDEAKLLKDAKTNTTISTRDRNLKILLLQYIRKYKKNPRQYYEHPKQIKNIPSWFEHALATFSENEIPKATKDGIREYFKALIAYRDSRIGSPDADEMEMLREQYGEASPYNDDYNPDFTFDHQDAIEQVDVNQHAQNVMNYTELPQGRQIEQSIMSAEQRPIVPTEQQLYGNQQPVQYETQPQQPPVDITGYLYGGTKKSAGNISSNVSGLDNIILNRKKPQLASVTQPVVAGKTTTRKTKKSKKKQTRKKQTKRKSPSIIDRVTLPNVETPIVSRKSPLASPIKSLRTPQPILIRDGGSTTRKATNEIISRVKIAKERSGVSNFSDIGIGSISIGRKLINTGKKTTRKTVASKDVKQLINNNFHFGRESFKVDKSKLKFDGSFNLSSDTLGEVKMLKQLVKNPSFSNMKKELRESTKSNKNTLSPPKITRFEFDYSRFKKKNRRQVYDDIDDFYLQN